jgi:hypothetical protein
MTIDEFDEKFRPVKNPHDSDAGWDGCLFGTRGVERNFVRNQPANKVWTLLSYGLLVSGYQLVDRVGYLVTEVAWEEEISVDENPETTQDDK